MGILSLDSLNVSNQGTLPLQPLTSDNEVCTNENNVLMYISELQAKPSSSFGWRFILRQLSHPKFSASASIVITH